MPVVHKVKQGECISSIAEDYGFSWERIWNDLNNEELKQKRKDPNILYPGDEVVIADKEVREEIDGQSFSGKTNGEGRVEQRIPPNAKQGQLRLGEDGHEVYNIQLGSLDPLSETAGVQQRLKNLGYECGSVDGETGPETREALIAFQKKHELGETGEINSETLDKLKQLHKS